MNKEYNLSSIKRCFIIDGNEYREVPADHVLDHGEYREDFKNRYFYPFKDILLEMSREDRRYFYACAESMENMIKQPKKQVKREKKFVMVSIEALLDEAGDGNQHLDFLEDHNSNVTEQVEHKILLESIKKYWSRLKPSEQKLLTEYYKEGKNERELAKNYGVKQSTIHNKRKRILAKLLKFFETEK